MLALLLMLLFAPATPPAACRDAVAVFERGDARAARVALVSAVQANAQSAYCAKALGVVQAALGDLRAAEPHFARACRHRPPEPDACYFWARALYSLDRFEESLAALTLAPAGGGWRVTMARGQALDGLNRPGAEAVLRQALAERGRDGGAPREPEPLLALAAFLHREGRSPEALRLLDAAPEGYQRLPAFHYERGRALAQGEAWREAAAALEKAVALRDNYPEAHGLLSRCYHQLDQPELGAVHARKARP
jgi:tetratricopeptide (TPR) repeat protein